MNTKQLDIDRKKVIKNAWRITNDRKRTCLRIRVPGGHLDTKYLPLIQTIAEKYGNGTVHLTTRQGFEIPGILWESIDEINTMLKPIIDSLRLKINCDNPASGYPAAGTRNIAACIGNRVCPFANSDTTALACKIEQEVYPHDFHFKIAITGCPNDCIKAHLHDFGIICTTIPQYNPDRCISCNACVDTCRKKVTEALSVEQYNIVRNEKKCIGCGECVKVCPTRAWTRSNRTYFRLLIMGRTGRKNPRLAAPFLKWATEDVVIGIIKNTYKFVNNYIDRTLPKEHIGYIVDRMGFEIFCSEALEGITLNPEAKMASKMEWHGYKYTDDQCLFG
jgi:anaerobic sulfite reductase subunit C